jgi:peptide/nickel transport system substrate-binding protein
VPNWILPITDPGHSGSPNTEQFSYLMWRPLYWLGRGDSPTLDPSLSLADPPTYSQGNKVVTIHLRNYNWSDGKPVSSRDVEFFFNLVKDDPADWSNYVAGNIPDNVASFKTVDAKTFQLTLNKPTSPQWFTNDQLSLITPMPQHAWDKTSSSGSVGDNDTTASGAKAVLKYLIGESKKLDSYTSNPLWSTIDGPWKLTKYTTDGQITFVPNPRYTGPNKPTYKTFEEVPFATDAAEFNSLLAGAVDYGYLPFNNLQQRPRIESHGFHFSAWNLWGINFIAINYINPQTGPIVSQLYMRQALESLVNQPLIIKQIFQGMGVQNFSPIAAQPANPYATVRSNPNPYDPAKAVSLLKQHGWNVKPGGVTTCANAGSGANQCGAGIPAGTRLGFSLLVNSGNKPVNLEMQALQSDWQQKAGIQLQVRPQPFTQVISTTFAACSKAKPSGCPWQMADWGGGVNLLPYPTGEQIFASSGSSNPNHYSDPKTDQLIDASHTGGQSELTAYEQYLTAQVPVIWVPNLTYQLSEIRNGLEGADAQNVYIGITPETWHW